MIVRVEVKFIEEGKEVNAVIAQGMAETDSKESNHLTRF
jgi:hypothetical protein